MAINAPLPQAEAKVVFRAFGTDTWRDSVDLDPVTIPVESTDTTDAYDPKVMDVVEAITNLETTSIASEYMLVWSATNRPVKGVCPVCDNVFIVSEGFTYDVQESPDAMFGRCAVICGCVDDN